MVERLLTSAVADMAVPVRRAVLESMKQMSDLDSYLAQADWYAQTDSASLDHCCDAHQAALLLEELLDHGTLVRTDSVAHSAGLDHCCDAHRAELLRRVPLGHGSVAGTAGLNQCDFQLERKMHKGVRNFFQFSHSQ